MKAQFVADNSAEYVKIRERLANKQPKAAKLSYAEFGLKMVFTLRPITRHLYPS